MSSARRLVQFSVPTLINNYTFFSPITGELCSPSNPISSLLDLCDTPSTSTPCTYDFATGTFNATTRALTLAQFWTEQAQLFDTVYLLGVWQTADYTGSRASPTQSATMLGSKHFLNNVGFAPATVHQHGTTSTFSVIDYALAEPCYANATQTSIQFSPPSSPADTYRCPIRQVALSAQKNPADVLNAFLCYLKYYAGFKHVVVDFVSNHVSREIQDSTSDLQRYLIGAKTDAHPKFWNNAIGDAIQTTVRGMLSSGSYVAVLPNLMRLPETIPGNRGTPETFRLPAAGAYPAIETTIEMDKTYVDGWGHRYSCGSDGHYVWGDTINLDYTQPTTVDRAATILRTILQDSVPSAIVVKRGAAGPAAPLSAATPLIDGFRCDMAHLSLNDVIRRSWVDRGLLNASALLPAEPWSTMIGRVRAAFPQTQFLAESYWDWADPLRPGRNAIPDQLIACGFTWLYTKGIYDCVKAVATTRFGDTPELQDGGLSADIYNNHHHLSNNYWNATGNARLASRTPGWTAPGLWFHLLPLTQPSYRATACTFLENHDELRAMDMFRPLLRGGSPESWMLYLGSHLFLTLLPGLQFYCDGQLSGKYQRTPVQLNTPVDFPAAPLNPRFTKHASFSETFGLPTAASSTSRPGPQTVEMFAKIVWPLVLRLRPAGGATARYGFQYGPYDWSPIVVSNNGNNNLVWYALKPNGSGPFYYLVLFNFSPWPTTLEISSSKDNALWLSAANYWKLMGAQRSTFASLSNLVASQAAQTRFAAYCTVTNPIAASAITFSPYEIAVLQLT